MKTELLREDERAYVSINGAFDTVCLLRSRLCEARAASAELQRKLTELEEDYKPRGLMARVTELQRQVEGLQAQLIEMGLRVIAQTERADAALSSPPESTQEQP